MNRRDAHVAQSGEGPAAPRPLPSGEREEWGSFLRSMGRVSAQSFGGPVAQIGVMHQEAVERRKWVTEGEFVHLLNFANILPGPEALELAIHLGTLRRGIAGGVVAGLMFIAPGFASLTLLAWVYSRWGSLPALTAVFDGVRPIATALIAAAAVRISTRSLQGPVSYLLLGASFLASFAGGIPFPAVLIGCGVLGIVLGRFRATGGRKTSETLAVAIVIVALSIGWLPSFAPALRLPGPPPPAVRMEKGGTDRLPAVAIMNTKAAFLTFGGAYTALPLLREESVVRHGWVSDAAMIDALALGETTPGPLICVAIFISYLAAGLPGALVGTFFLFLPSFLLVLVLGPHMSRVERIPKAHEFLWGVSAATVGLILALSARIVPRSLDDGIAVAIAVIAFVAVWRFKLNVVAAVGGGAALGLLGYALGAGS